MSDSLAPSPPGHQRGSGGIDTCQISSGYLESAKMNCATAVHATFRRIHHKNDLQHLRIVSYPSLLAAPATFGLHSLPHFAYYLPKGNILQEHCILSPSPFLPECLPTISTCWGCILSPQSILSPPHLLVYLIPPHLLQISVQECGQSWGCISLTLCILSPPCVLSPPPPPPVMALAALLAAVMALVAWRHILVAWRHSCRH